MTYVSTGLIEANDYNNFVSVSVAGNVNAAWGTPTATGGYGQGNIATVAAGTTGATAGGCNMRAEAATRRSICKAKSRRINCKNCCCWKSADKTVETVKSISRVT